MAENGTAVVEYHGTAVATVDEVLNQTKRIKEIMARVMIENVHYGIIPGVKKPSLWKPGAESLCVAFHIAPTYPQVIEDRFDDGVRYRVKCVGVHQGSGRIVAEGIGSCSSMEEKYKWRRTYSNKEFDNTDPARRRIDFYWDKDKRAEYEIKQIRAETADEENTLLKMAAKRAMIAMTLNALAASDVFAQDLEDLSKKVLEQVVDETEGAGGDDKKKGYKEPRSKKDKTSTAGAATGTTATARTAATASQGNPEPAKVELANEGMIAHFSKKIEEAGSTWKRELDWAKFPAGHQLTKDDCKAMLLHAQQPTGKPSTASGELALQP
jgi:hypothetical protein